MPMMLVRGLGEGAPASAPGNTATDAFNFSALPGQIFTGAQKWMSPGDAFSYGKTFITGGGGDVGVAIGVIGVPLLLLAMLKGRRR